MIDNKTGEEIEKLVQEKAEKIVDDLKGENYRIVNKILEKAKLILERRAIVK